MNKPAMLISTVTPKEHFLRYGNLPDSVIEDLIDLNERIEGSDSIAAALCKIDEAQRQFPNEDFLSAVTDRLRILANRLRGENKIEGLTIVTALDDLQLETIRASEYGMAELTDAKSALKKLEE